MFATLFNCPTRTRLAQADKSIRLDTLGMLHALLVPRMDWTVLEKNWLLVLLAISNGYRPAASWAGATTPISILNLTDSDGILVPSFREASTHVWGQRFEDGDHLTLKKCYIRIQSSCFGHGLDCSVLYYLNTLLDMAREVTTPDAIPRNPRRPSTCGVLF